MWEKLFQLFKELVFVNELSRRNADEIKELRNRVDEIQRTVELLAVKIDYNRDNEALEREKLLLRIENLLLTRQIPTTKAAPKQLKKKN